MDMIKGRHDARAYCTAVIHGMGNAMHLKTAAIVLLENTHNAMANGMAAEVGRQIGNLDLVRAPSRQRANRRHPRPLVPDKVASAHQLRCWTDRQTEESKRRNDILRSRNLLLNDRQQSLDALPVAGREIGPDGCAESVTMIRVDRQPPLITLRRLVLPVELGQSITADKERICVTLIDCDRVVRILQSLSVLSECLERKGAVDQCFRIVIVLLENALVRGKRLRYAIKPRQNIAAIVERVDMVGLESERPVATS